MKKIILGIVLYTFPFTVFASALSVSGSPGAQGDLLFSNTFTSAKKHYFVIYPNTSSSADTFLCIANQGNGNTYTNKSISDLNCSSTLSDGNYMAVDVLSDNVPLCTSPSTCLLDNPTENDLEQIEPYWGIPPDADYGDYKATEISFTISGSPPSPSPPPPPVFTSSTLPEVGFYETLYLYLQILVFGLTAFITYKILKK